MFEKQSVPRDEDTMAEETGGEEPLSKNALKKKLKAEKAAKAKAEKEAARKAKEAAQPTSKKAVASDDDLDPSQYKQNREAVVKAMEDSGRTRILTSFM